MNETLARVRRAGFVVELRLRLARMINVLPIVLATGVALAAVALAVHKVWPERLDMRHTRFVFETLGGLGALAALVSLLRPLPPQAGTMALDKHYRLNDRLTNAVAFEALPPKERTPFMQLAIDDARAHVAGVKPSKVAPIFAVVVAAVFSVEMLLFLLAGVGLGGVSLLEIRTLVPDPPAPPPAQKGLAMNGDDLQLFRDAAKDLDRPNQSPEMKAAIERFNRLIEDLAERRLDRTEAFRQMADIERDLNKNIDADQDKLKKELQETAKDLSASELTKELAEALDKNDLDKAKEKMKELAKELREQKKPLDPKAKERLEKALKEAAARRKEALDAIEDQRSKLQQSLLQRRQEADAEKDPEKKKEDERLLKKDERELERLDREQEKQSQANRELSKLDRDLSQAAQDLMKDLGLSADDLDQAAEDMNHMQQQQMSEKDKEELKQRLEELREILKQQGQGGKKRASRMKNFSKRARGGKGSSGQQGQNGNDPGQGDQGKDGDGKDGQGDEDGDGDGDKDGNGKMGGIELKRGNGPGSIPIPGAGGKQPGDGSGQGDGQGQDGQNGGQGDGTSEGSHNWGKGPGGPVAGKETDLKGDTQEVHEDGIDTGQGNANQKAILVAAEKGFRGSGYKQVFTKYKTKAEDNIDKEEVPDGYRFYVKRYFQLIRPRE